MRFLVKLALRNVVYSSSEKCWLFLVKDFRVQRMKVRTAYRSPGGSFQDALKRLEHSQGLSRSLPHVNDASYKKSYRSQITDDCMHIRREETKGIDFPKNQDISHWDTSMPFRKFVWSSRIAEATEDEVNISRRYGLLTSTAGMFEKWHLPVTIGDLFIGGRPFPACNRFAKSVEKQDAATF